MNTTDLTPIELIQRTAALAVKIADSCTLDTDEFEQKYHPLANPGAFRDEAAALISGLASVATLMEAPRSFSPSSRLTREDKLWIIKLVTRVLSVTGYLSESTGSHIIKLVDE